MKSLVLALASLFGLLQHELWNTSGGLAQVWQHKQVIATLQNESEVLKQRNTVILADINDLKRGTEAIESYARTELGMVKENEVFYQVVP
jgi:cell division protein FtsB